MDLNVQKFTSNQINNLKLVKNGDSGHFGKVYRLNEQECIKIFNDTLINFRINRLNEQTKVSFDFAEMPKRLAVIDREIKGYTMNYISGEVLSDCMDWDFSDFLRIYSNFIKHACEEAASERFLIVDACSRNIMIDDNGNIKLIDTDLWDKKNIIGEKELIKLNFNMLNAAFKTSLLGFFNDADLTIDDDYIDYYETIRNNIEKSNDIKIKTIGELRSHNMYSKLRDCCGDRLKI